jgi:hypothetical protein
VVAPASVPVRPCPACEADTPESFGDVNADTYLWDYICPACGDMWTVSKTDETDIHHMTPLRPFLPKRPPLAHD